MSVTHLEKLFKPNSVAVIGASNVPGSVGFIVMQNLLSGKFLGPVMPISPGLDAVSGVLSYKSVDTLPLTPDLAIVCVEPDLAPDYVKDLGRRGCMAAAVLPPGYNKLSRGQKDEFREKIMAAAHPRGVRILGPSGLGLIVPGIGLNASLAPSDAAPGRIAFISQSSSLFATVLDWARSNGIGFSHLVSLGDPVDVEFSDILDYLVLDPKTRSILLYVESVGNARAFLSAARAAARNKPVLVIKPGRNIALPLGEASEVSQDEVYDEAFRRAGMLRVFQIDSLFDAAQTLAWSQPLRGDKLAILTNGGSVGLMAADAVLGGGGSLANLDEDTKNELDELLGPNWSRQAIVDLSFDASGKLYADALRALLRDKEVNAVLVMHVPFAGVSGEEAARAVSEIVGKTSRAVFTCWLGFEAAEAARAVFSQAGIPTYETQDKAVSAFLHLVRHRRNQELLMQMPASLPSEFSVDAPAARRVVEGALAAGRLSLSEPEAKEVLSAYGVPVIASREAADLEGAVLAAEEIGYPVALKVVSPEVPVPYDVGGIALDLKSSESLREAGQGILERVLALIPQARIHGFIVQEMRRRPGIQELMIQGEVDPVFGPYVRFGQGGLAARLTRDKAVALPPLNMSLARDLVMRTRVSKFLEGEQGEKVADVGAVCLTIIQVGHLISDIPEIVGVDINPLFASARGVAALGARIRIAPTEAASDQRLAIRPYPRELEETANLKDGRSVMIRPIRPEDEPAHYEFFKRLTPEDLRYRFFGVVRELSHKEMARLTQIDYEREMAFIAQVVGEDGEPETLGVVRTSTKPDNSAAEFAIIARSDAKGLGLGSLLMNKMIRYCRERGTGKITGQALLVNKGMQGLATKLGFEVHRDSDDDIVEMSLTLNEPEEAAQ